MNNPIFSSIALAGVVALAGASAAFAADLPARTPYVKAPVVAPAYNWTGLYLGVNAGVGMGRDYTRLDIPVGTSFEASYLNPLGGVVGGQIGYNWQISNTPLGALVFGVEADIQAASLRDNVNCLIGCIAGQTLNIDQRLDWFGTARGRVGIAKGPVLGYFTGGYAAGSVKTTVTETVGTTGAFASNQTRGGWTYGSGVEASLGGNWTGKIEYLQLYLANRVDSFTLNGLAHTMTSNVREHIFRVGLNYRVNGATAGYVAPPPANWTGFYIGGNAGSGVARDRSSLSFAGVGTVTETFNLSPSGFLGGVQAGYNWQSANWVFGIEADIQGSAQRDNRTCVQTCNLGPAAPIIFAAYDARLPWFGTVRGRLGYSLGSNLFYGTAGYAYGGVKTRIASAFNGVAASAEISNTTGGWTAGAGLERPFEFFGLFGPNWTSKTEYLYVALGRSTGSYTIATAPVVTVTNSTEVREHIFRTGLNYHFNSPVVARY